MLSWNDYEVKRRGGDFEGRERQKEYLRRIRRKGGGKERKRG